jgi:XTP/dITP diphosphohydrolase
MSGPTEPTLLIATTNPGKLREIRALLPPDVIALSLRDVGGNSVEETGATFAENAALKATAAARETDLLTLADDSGLEVAALGGAPGVRSARYAGEPSHPARNRRQLLQDLALVPRPLRAARFVCAMALADAHGLIATSEGELRGTIAGEERGSGGFGYDPIFELPDGRTLAELLDEEKNAVSHRGAALAAILPATITALPAHRPVKTPSRP